MHSVRQLKVWQQNDWTYVTSFLGLFDSFCSLGLRGGVGWWGNSFGWCSFEEIEHVIDRSEMDVADLADDLLVRITSHHSCRLRRIAIWYCSLLD
jgi:hypothetical protein